MKQRQGRISVRLKTQAVWERLELLDRSQNWLARQAGMSPLLPVHPAEPGARPLRAHPAQDAESPERA